METAARAPAANELTVADIAHALRQAGEGGKRIAVIGAAAGIGTTMTAVAHCAGTGARLAGRPDRSFARSPEACRDHRRSARARHHRSGARHRVVRADHHARPFFARPGHPGRAGRARCRRGPRLGAAGDRVRCAGAHLRSRRHRRRASRRMPWTGASHVLHRAPCWSRAGLRPQSPSAIRDHLMHCGLQRHRGVHRHGACARPENETGVAA